MSPLSITRFLAILCCAGMLQLGFVEIIEAQSIPQLPRPDIGNPGGQGVGTQQGSGRQGKPRRPRPGIQGADMSTDKSENKIGKFEELLENKDLSRFRGYKQTAVPSGWKMDGKNVHFDGSGGGDMVTVDEYDNFELQFDWKISAGGNSGVMYRVSLGDNAPYFSGPEYQVLDNDKHADGKNELTSAGALYAMYPPSEKRARKVGIWNTTKIIVNGNKIVHYLNGTRIVEAEIGSDDWNSRLGKSKFNSWEKFAKNTSGHIAFQDHGNEVWFRKIRIKRLQPSAMASNNNQRGSTNFGQNNGPGGLAPPSLGGNRGGPPAGVGDRGGRGFTPPAAGGGNSRQMSNGKSRRPRPNFKPAESGFGTEDDKNMGDDRGGRNNGPGGLAPPSLGGNRGGPPAGVGNRGGQNNGPGGLAPPSLGGNRGGPPAGVGDRGGSTRQMSNGKSRRPRPNFKPAESGFGTEDDKNMGDDRGGRNNGPGGLAPPSLGGNRGGPPAGVGNRGGQNNGPGGLAPPSLGGQPAGVGNRGGSTRQMSNGKSRRPRPNFKPAESGFGTEDDKNMGDDRGGRNNGPGGLAPPSLGGNRGGPPAGVGNRGGQNNGPGGLAPPSLGGQPAGVGNRGGSTRQMSNGKSRRPRPNFKPAESGFGTEDDKNMGDDRGGRNNGPGGLAPPSLGGNRGGPPAGVGNRGGQNNGPGGLAPPSLGGNRGGPPAGVGDRGGSTRQMSNGKSRRPRPNFKPAESGFESGDDKKAGDDRGGRDNGPGGLAPPSLGGQPAGVGNRGGSTRQMSNGKSRRPRPNFKPAESGFESGDDKKAGDDRGGRDNGPGGLAPPSLGGQPAGVGNRGGSTRQMSNGKSRRPRPNFKPAESGFETEDDKKSDKKEDAKDNKDN